MHAIFIVSKSEVIGDEPGLESVDIAGIITASIVATADKTTIAIGFDNSFTAFSFIQAIAAHKVL